MLRILCNRTARRSIRGHSLQLLICEREDVLLQLNTKMLRVIPRRLRDNRAFQ